MDKKYIENDIPIEIINADVEDVTGLQDDIDQELNSIFSEFGGGEDDDYYEVRVYRVQPGNAKLSYLFACLPSELPILDRLRDSYGGGTFEIRILKNKKIFRRKSCSVEKPVKNNTASLSTDDTGNQTALIAAMQSGFDRLGDMLIHNHAPQPQQSALDIIEMQTATLNNMALMKTLIGGGGDNNNNNNQNPLDMLKKLIEIQNSVTPPDSGGNIGTNLLNLANTILPKLAEMGEREQELKAAQIRRPKRRRPPPPHLLNNPIRKDPNQTKDNNPMKMQLVFLCLQARMKRDPSLYAQMVIDNTPVEQIPDLREFLAGSNPLKKMGEIHKAVLKYPVWFQKLSIEIVNMIGKARINTDSLTDQKVATINNNEIVSNELPNITGVHKIAIDGNQKPKKPETAKQNNS